MKRRKAESAHRRREEQFAASMAAAGYDGPDYGVSPGGAAAGVLRDQGMQAVHRALQLKSATTCITMLAECLQLSAEH